MKRRRTYRSWESMKPRCGNPNNDAYERYGGRGITYPVQWEKFSGFLEDMGYRPEGTTLDRKDNDGNYYKENCRWATYTQQTENRRPQVKAPVHSTTGVLGVYALNTGKYRVRVTVEGKYKTLYQGTDLALAIQIRHSWDKKE